MYNKSPNGKQSKASSMALKSMTGYGEGSASGGGFRIAVELSSVNRKQLDIQVALPRGLQAFESSMHTLIRDLFSRGRISGSVRLESIKGSATRVVMDQRLASSYVEALERLSKTLGSCEPIQLETVARMPEVLQVETTLPKSDELGVLFTRAMEKALRALKKMRSAEGRELELDLRDRIDQLEAMRRDLIARAPELTAAYRARLLVRLAEQGLEEWAEDERIIREVALFAERSDITEELIRLRSHLKQMRSHSRSKEPAGRPLDFLCQEVFREINTIGSKALDSRITQMVVQFKTELERIREQIQNVE